MSVNRVSFRDDEVNALTVGGLLVALQTAIGFVIFPQRLDVDSPHTPSDRLEALSRHILSEAKNLAPTGSSEAEEAAGITLAVRLIESIVADIRQKTV